MGKVKQYGEGYLSFLQDTNDCQKHKEIIRTLDDLLSDVMNYTAQNIEYGYIGSGSPLGEVDYLGELWRDSSLHLFEVKSTHCPNCRKKAREQMERATELFVPMYQKHCGYKIKSVLTYFVAEKDHNLVIENLGYRVKNKNNNNFIE